MAHIEDRWLDAEKNRTDRWGRGKRYRARYTDPSGRERSRSYAKKGDAETFLDNISASMIRGEYVDPQAGKITLQSYAETWLAGADLSPSTREKVEMRLRVHVYPKLGDKTLSQLAQRPSLVAAWLSALPLAVRSKLSVLDHLSAIMKSAVGDGLIIRNPCTVKSVVKRPRPAKTKIVPWETDRVVTVREALPAYLRGLADVGSGLGLREGEAFGLSPEDIDWLRGIVHVRRQVKVVRNRLCFDLPKGIKQRDVPLPKSVRERLSAHLARFPAREVTLPEGEPGGKLTTVSLMFTNRSGGAIARSWFGGSDARPGPWLNARRAAGVPPGREGGFHALRHHFASLLLRDGVGVREVAEYMGHHDPGFTLRVYGHLMPGAEDRMRRAVDNALNGESGGPQTPRAAEG